VDLARFRLNLAERAVEINRKRLEEQQIRIDQVDPQQVVDTENDLLNAENTRDDAVRDLRVAILNYLLASDQLRVAADGTIAELGRGVGQ
jgi:outer membrane protein TolC